MCFDPDRELGSKVQLSWDEARELAIQAFVAQGADQSVAQCVADALVLADADGQSGHGLSRIPSYVEQMQCQKVSGSARPFVGNKTHSTIEIKANGGFAYPALDLAVDELINLCQNHSDIAMAAIVGSHHCGVAGHSVEKLARHEFVGLMFANTPKAMHAFGSKQALFGTNPIAFACPRKDHDPIVLDLSLSVVARGKIVQAAGQGDVIPSGWGIDASGQASTDPSEVLKGSLNAIGGSKGMALALMVEILAGAFVSSQFGFQASSFFDKEGGPPHVGQLLLCMNPLQFNEAFYSQIELLVDVILSEQGARLPGSKRVESRQLASNSGLTYPQALISQIKALTSA